VIYQKGLFSLYGSRVMNQNASVLRLSRHLMTDVCVCVCVCGITMTYGLWWFISLSVLGARWWMRC